MRRISLSVHNRTSKLWTGWVEARRANNGKRSVVAAPARIEAFASEWLSWTPSAHRAREHRLLVVRPGQRGGSGVEPVTGELVLDFPVGHTEAIVFLEEPRPGQVLLRAIYVW